MCGIWGYQFVKEETPLRRSFTSRSILVALLMHTMEDRGEDSWGVALRSDVDTNEQGIAIIKDVGPCTKLVDPCLIASCHQVMGHTRKASAGAVSKANAHPFRIKHIVGMHNGSVTNYRDLNTTHKRSCDVDSEHIFHHLADGKDLDELAVSGAAVWVDTKRPDTIQMVRSFAGQLSIRGISVYGTGRPEVTEGIVWASTSTALEEAVALAGYESFEFTVDPERRYEVTGGKLTVHEKYDFNPSIRMLGLPLSTSRSGVSTTYYNVWELHPVFGTRKPCDRENGCVIRWHMEHPDDKLIMQKWLAGTLTTADVPYGDPTVMSDGVLTRVPPDAPPSMGDTCKTCNTFQEYTYLSWDDKVGGFVCWNCDPTASGYLV